jgi:four helix bundle protein
MGDKVTATKSRGRMAQVRYKPRMIQSHRELLVWQRSIQLSVAIYQLTASFPKHEVWGLTSQLRRASVSVASNIAEGYGRGTKGEYKQFLSIARGSTLEVQTQLVIAKELRFASIESFSTVENLTIEIDKMLNAILKKLSVRH